MFTTHADVPPLGRSRRRRAAAVVAPLALIAALTGCAADGASGGASLEGPAGSDSGEAARAEPGGEAQDAAPGEDSGSNAAADVPVAERDLVHTADLAVEVDDVPDAAEEAVGVAESAGGYVVKENVSTAQGSPPHASLTLHVPQERYDGALDELSALGSRANLDRRVSDVTEEVADVDSRVESAEASLERLRELLDEAESVEDVLAVEEQISTRQQDLEALQARQETLAQQTSYGTVRLELDPPETYVEEPADDSIGFLGGLQRGWRALVGVAQAVSVAAGWVLPFAVPAAALAAAVWLPWRRRRAARSRTAEPAPAGDGAAQQTGGEDGERAESSGEHSAAEGVSQAGTGEGPSGDADGGGGPGGDRG
ncbi:DUF4349 domain-containing protein [Streptomonospora alba]|uniref:DUF4349 domain-containing protein n=1 Tax=Streptomonospora alba TaxID=183763 RepID=UPI0006993C84|nr:DUF4349 domain-containing protein [Streptomonospora alba]